MARKKMLKLTTMGGQYEPALAVRVMELAKANGITIKELLRRLMVDAVLTGRVPGVEALQLHEHREHEKYGTATPVYDGNSERQQPSKDGKKAPSPHLE